MELLNVSSPEFRPYGRVISGYDVSGLMKAMESTPFLRVWSMWLPCRAGGRCP